jgi:hypothetical protein
MKKQLHPEVQTLLTEIEMYCARSNTDHTNFGIQALNDGHFVRRLYLGRVPKLDTIDRVRGFIDDKTRAVPRRKGLRR